MKEEEEDNDIDDIFICFLDALKEAFVLCAKASIIFLILLSIIMFISLYKN